MLIPAAARVPGTRLWLRSALRRPVRGLLVVLGLLAMSVATVAALVAADSLERLFVADAIAQWGDVDVVAFRPGDAVIDEGAATSAGIEGAGPDAAWAGRLLLDTVVASGPDARDAS